MGSIVYNQELNSRAMTAARSLGRLAPRDSIGLLAKQIGVSAHLLGDCRTLIMRGSPLLSQAVEQGLCLINQALIFYSLVPREEQDAKWPAILAKIKVGKRFNMRGALGLSQPRKYHAPVNRGDGKMSRITDMVTIAAREAADTILDQSVQRDERLADWIDKLRHSRTLLTRTINAGVLALSEQQARTTTSTGGVLSWKPRRRLGNIG